MNDRLSIDVDQGELRVSRNAEIHVFTLGRYTYALGDIFYPYYPIASTDIPLRSTVGLAVGDNVELRNEYQGRLNEPRSHKAIVTGVTETGIVIDDVPRDAALTTDRGAFIRKTRSGQIQNLTLMKAWDRLGQQYWQFAGQSDELGIRLSISYDEASAYLRFSVERTYLAPTRVLNESMTVKSLPPLLTAVRKNRAVKTAPFGRSLRLERQGAQFTDGVDRHVRIQHAPGISSLGLLKECPDAEFVPVSKFFPPPNDLAAAMERTGSYASGWSKEGQDTSFEIVFPREVDARGLRIAWLRADGKPVGVTLTFLSNETVTGRSVTQCDPSTTSDDIVLDADALADKIRVDIAPGTVVDGRGRVFMSHIEVLFGGDDYNLVVNMDDYRDHRFYSHLEAEHRVYEPPMTRVTEDRSAYLRSSGDMATSDFSLYLGPPPTFDPRIMHVPYAYDAMLLWTEHADASTLESHRAAYFGRSDISRASDAVGGFVYWGIPVTKSVFFDNPDRLPPRPGMPAEQVALSTDPAFWEFCTELEEYGSEICLHSDQPQNSSPESFAAAIDVFYSNFSSSSWIDHSPMTVSGGASGQGSRRGSPYYAISRWKDRGVRFFWTIGSEDFTSGDAKSGLNVFETIAGDDRITPLYWEHEIEAPGLCFWACLRGGRADVYTEENIERLIAERGICINHTYPAAVYLTPKAKTNYLDFASDGSARTTSVFETALRTISMARDEGRLLPTTVPKALRYLQQLDDVSVEFRPDNSALVSSRADVNIPGFTLALPKARISVKGHLPDVIVRETDSDILVSFELRAQSTVLLEHDEYRLSLTAIR